MKVLAAQLNLTIGDIEGNTRKIVDALQRARGLLVDIVLFSELTISGYPPEDLLLDADFIEACMQQLERIAPFTKKLFVAVGLPRWNPSKKEKPLYNSAAIFIDGHLVGFKNKTLLPTYDIFDERRYFEPGAIAQPVWEYLGWKIAVTICEDAWHHCSAASGAQKWQEGSSDFGLRASSSARELGASKDGKSEEKPTLPKPILEWRTLYTNYLCDPIQEVTALRPNLMLNLSASPYAFHKKQERLAVFQAASKTLACPLVLCNQVGANDQIVFDGDSLFLNEKGELIQKARGFVEADLVVDLDTRACAYPFVENEIEDLYTALVLGLKDYFYKQNFQTALLGLSGGIDSALVACIAVEALGASHVRAFSLPSRFSSPASYEDAALLASRLGIALHTLSIDSLFQDVLDCLEPQFADRPWDATEENIQSRIRGMTLMAFSNKFGSILLNTGNKSEMAMGYTTLYGDLCGGIGVLLDVLKTRVYQLAHWVNRAREVIPMSILTKTPTAELRPNQTDFDTLPSYEILDGVIEDYIENRMPLSLIAQRRALSLDFVATLVQRMHQAEYKRRQAPLAIRVSPKCFSKGRNVPIVQRWQCFPNSEGSSHESKGSEDGA